jgi:hypothetical protein
MECFSNAKPGQQGWDVAAAPHLEALVLHLDPAGRCRKTPSQSDGPQLHATRGDRAQELEEPFTRERHRFDVEPHPVPL